MSKPKFALCYCQIKFYYELHRIFSLIINQGHWYCFRRKVPDCCTENLVRNWCLYCVLKIESKKPIKQFGKVKKDPIEMWKNFATSNADLKKSI